MLRKNVFVSIRDTAAGVNFKAWGPPATAAQTGPYPPQNLGDDTAEPPGFPPGRLDGKRVGTASTPVVVLSPRSEAIGRNADAWGVMRASPAGTLTRRPFGSRARPHSDGGERITTSFYGSQERGDPRSGGGNFELSDIDSASTSPLAESKRH